MIVDSSALVAMALQEAGHDLLIDKLSAATQAGIGAPTLVETAIVLSARLRRDARGAVARMIQELGIEIVPFADAHYGIAVDAWLRFGKGRHPAGLTAGLTAGLNFGDCLTYAVAKLTRRPLLCTGEDFTKTDLELA
jgi:ribonuclease VapC